MKKKTENKPAFETRLGNVRVSVWKNTTDNGAWFNVVPLRRYLDRDADEWKDSTTFNGLGDLAVLVEGLRLARDFIASQTNQDGSEK